MRKFSPTDRPATRSSPTWLAKYRPFIHRFGDAAWRVGRAGIAWLLLLAPLLAAAEDGGFRFAWLSDTHVGSGTGAEDLRASVRDINSLTGLSFVVLSGDVTEYGSDAQLRLAKSILDTLRVPCHVIPGNHDAKWSESGATTFARLWGSDRFAFDAGGLRFLGMHEGPVMKMGDGHFAPQDVRWLDAALASLPDPRQPIVFVTHYPLDDGIDNWFVVLDRLKRFNVQAVLVGHGHSNRKLNFEGVPAVMGRSNLRAKAKVGGYTLVEVRGGTMTFAERLPGVETKPPWDSVKLERHDFAALTNRWPRPDLGVNTNYPAVKARWQTETGWTIAASPAIAGDRAIIGDASGTVRALALETGATLWRFPAGGPVYSTPAVGGDCVVFASTDGAIYGLNWKTGAKLWEYRTGKPLVASPGVADDRVFLGASDGKFRALDLATGKLAWETSGIGGFVETRPLVRDGRVIFGAWDQHLYALDAKTGAILWKWKGSQPGVLYSPAACWPVQAGNRVFIVAPDRVMTVLDAATGRQVWRSGEWPVRESIGMAADASRFYVRTMPGEILAFATDADRPQKLWSLNAHFGYDINSAMLVEKDGVLFYGTKNGLLLAIDAASGALRWEHRVGVALLNTVAPLSAREVLVSDTDGKVTLIEAPADSR